MRAGLASPIVIEHRHGEIGPDSRPHFHTWNVSVSYEGTFNPATGQLADFEQFSSTFSLVIASYDRRNLHEISGIRPTMESLALRLREDMLSSFVNTRRDPLRVRISDGSDRMVEVP